MIPENKAKTRLFVFHPAQATPVAITDETVDRITGVIPILGSNINETAANTVPIIAATRSRVLFFTRCSFPLCCIFIARKS